LKGKKYRNNRIASTEAKTDIIPKVTQEAKNYYRDEIVD
jgi:hypothetical protein